MGDNPVRKPIGQELRRARLQNLDSQDATPTTETYAPHRALRNSKPPHLPPEWELRSKTNPELDKAEKKLLRNTFGGAVVATTAAALAGIVISLNDC